MIKNKITYFFICLFYLPVMMAEIPHVSFITLTTEHGLSSNMIHALIQDHQGYLWIGTADGLDRYDGYTFVSFKPPHKEGSNLKKFHVNTIVQDKEENIWIGTSHGLDRFDPKHNKFESFYADSAEKAHLTDNEINALLVDYSDNLWIGTGKGLNRIQKNDTTFIHYYLQSGPVNSIYQDKAGTLWVGTEFGSVAKYIPESDSFEEFINQLYDFKEIGEPNVWFINENADGNILIGTSFGLYSFDQNLKEFKYSELTLKSQSSFRNNEFRFMHVSEDRSIWIGTWGKGLYHYSTASQTGRNYQVEPNNLASLSNNDVNVIVTDQSGVMWVGTQDGLNKYDPSASLFQHYYHIPNNENSISLNYVTAFCEDQQNNLWIGTYGGGISRFNLTTNNFKHFKYLEGNRNSLVNDAVRGLEIDADQNIWIATHDGLSKYKPGMQSFVHFRHEPGNTNSICSDNIMVICIDRASQLWIGTYGEGISVYHLKDKNFRHYNTKNSAEFGLKSDFIREIYADKYGNIYVGTIYEGGLYVFDKNRSTFQELLINDTIKISNVNSIHEDDNGFIWIGTWDGLYRYNRKTDEVRIINIEEGLPHQRIIEVQDDDHGNIWISSHKGLSKLTINKVDSVKIFNYTVSNGIQGNEFNVNASIKTRSGQMFFGGTNGFNGFYPENVTTNNFVPPVLITDFQIFNKSVAVNEKVNGRIVLQKTISESEHLYLNHKHKVISFEFAALSFSLQNKNQYAYKMEGVDNDWVYTDYSRRFASYSNLNHGDYIFRVKASNNDGIWNEEGTQIYLHVAPPPWKTYWAYFIYILLLGLILLAFRTFIMTRANLKHSLKIERLEREKIEEVNQIKLKFFTNISHEFKTPLTLILSPLERLIENGEIPENLKAQFDLMHRNAKRLVALINQLMTFRKLDTGNMKLTPVKGDIVEFIRSLSGAFTDFATQHQIAFQVVTSEQSIVTYFDQDKLEKIFYNLISNAFKFTPNNGKIEIVIEIEQPVGQHMIRSLKPGQYDSFITIKVLDTGTGISPDRLSKIFDRFYQISKSQHLIQNIEQFGTGIGLSFTKELVELHHGQITVESEVGKGSVFKVKLPMNLKYYENDDLTDSLTESDRKLFHFPENFTNESELAEEISTGMGEKNKKINIPIILVIEDNSDVRSFIKNSFESVFEVLEASDGKEGFEKAVEFNPDLIITDIMMPEMDGIELCKLLKEQVETSHIPIILLTARANLESKIEGLETGADAYIPKPFNIKHLEVQIKNLLKSREQLKKAFMKKILLEPSDVTISSTDEKFMKKALESIEANISDPDFNVEEFGNIMGHSRMQLYRKLKALTDLSPNEFIRNIRLKRSAQILEQGQLNISEVSYMVGFNDPKYFSRCFHKQFGCTPSEYVNQKIQG